MLDSVPTIVVASGGESAPTSQSESVESIAAAAETVAAAAETVAEAAETIAETSQQSPTQEQPNAELSQRLTVLETQTAELRTDFESLREMVTEEIPDEVEIETTEIIVPPTIEAIPDEPRPNFLQRWLL